MNTIFTQDFTNLSQEGECEEYTIEMYSLVTDDILKHRFYAKDDKEVLALAREHYKKYGKHCESEYRIYKTIF